MPTYEYKCSACGYEFEEFQAISAKPVRKCPQCGKSAVNRLISAGGGVIFRGSGFYETDYRSENYKAGAKKESDDGKASTDTKLAGTGKKDAASTVRAAATAESSAVAPSGKKSRVKAGKQAL